MGVLHSCLTSACPFDRHDTLLFGRDEDCHARILKDAQVSRHHFLLEVNPPAARLRDLGSLNGTFVQHQRVDKAALQSGDEIQIGKYKLAFLEA